MPRLWKHSWGIFYADNYFFIKPWLLKNNSTFAAILVTSSFEVLKGNRVWISDCSRSCNIVLKFKHFEGFQNKLFIKMPLKTDLLLRGVFGKAIKSDWVRRPAIIHRFDAYEKIGEEWKYYDRLFQVHER